MATLREIQSQIIDARTSKEGQEQSYRFGKQFLLQAEKKIAKLKRQDVTSENADELGALLSSQKEVDESLPKRKQEWQRAKLNLQAIKDLLKEKTPKDWLNELPDHTPFLLFPIKIETKFARNSEGQPELWVRFFPDRVAAESHEEAMSENEIEEGRQLWRDIFESKAKTEEEQELIAKGVWNRLVNSHGPNRGHWIAKSNRPFNINFANSEDELQFPEFDFVKESGWTAPPSTSVMPDRFEVLAYQFDEENNKLVLAKSAFGNLIPDTLELGPDPSQLEEEFKRDEETGQLTVDPGMEWMVNFDKAIEVGMGLKMPINRGEAINGFDRLVVIGMRLTDDEFESANKVERLLEGHRYTDGMAFLPKGTPTNNSEEVPSGLDTQDVGSEKSFEGLVNNLDFPSWDSFLEKENKADGQHFAEALGLGYETIYPVQNAEQEDVAEAFAMNKALYPATLGNYLEEWLGAAFDKKTRDLMEGFFLKNVSGRGFIPSFRVGDQPYGVLVTSSMRRWKMNKDEVGREALFHRNFAALLRGFYTSWVKIGRKAKHVGDDADFKQRLLDILGLHPSSVEYFSRRALADEFYMNNFIYHGFGFDILSPTWHILQAQKFFQLAAMKLGNFKDLKIRDISFFNKRSKLNGPVVDGDPKLPLSETKGITPFFKKEGDERNYIHWLLKAGKKDLKIERFINESNEGVSPPRALLYMYLRQALLNEMTTAAKGFLRVKKQIQKMPTNPSMVNMRGAKHFADKDLWNVDVNLEGQDQQVSDFVHRKFRTATIPDIPDPQDFALMAKMLRMRGALEKLADLPTARLERLFAEHMDTCSYRLDAWVTGLFQSRLDFMRFNQAGRVNEDGSFDDFGEFSEGQPRYNRGVYIGSYGFVENLRPRKKAPQPASDSEVPESMRTPGETIVKDPNNGGYVLAPSLNHAVTSAVLLNAYMSHADSDNDSQFAVNLSSRRVRKALKVLDGLRNGQSMGALLGYQLERALHDNPEKEELDEFIYVLRERFPLISGKLIDVPDDGSAEVIEANNVINGYDLLHFTKDKNYPYGLPTGDDNLPAANTPKGRIIAREIDQLANTLDAVGDLATSESVYQAVQGNFDRTGGMLKALSEGTPPPEPDFIRTPRNGKVITQRVCITFDPTAGSTAANWGAETVRSKANAPVNDWLAKALPNPTTIGFQAVVGNIPSPMDLTEAFDLQPIDFVLISGNQLGDLSSELERYLIHKIKSKPGNEAEEVTVVFNKADSGKTPLSLLQPLMRSLRRVITESRSLHAQDFMTGIEGQDANAANPQGYLDGLNGFKAKVQAIYDKIAAELDESGTGLMNFYKTEIEALYTTLAEDPDQVVVPAWEGLLDQVRPKLAALVPFALPEALPSSLVGFTKIEVDALVGQVISVLDIFGKRKLEVDEGELLVIPDFNTIEKEEDKGTALENAILNLTQAAKTLLNESFIAVPFFKANNKKELKDSLDKNILPEGLKPSELKIEKWLQGAGKVREKVDNLTTLATTHDMLLDEAFDLSPVQLPFNENGHWVGDEFPEGYSPENDTVSLMLHQSTALDPDATLCGILVDEWTEVIPEKEVSAGITFHYNRPNAMPPQSLLMAVPATLDGKWDYDELVDIIHETIDLAKLRALEPNHLMRSVGFQVLPAVMSELTRFNFSTNLKNNVIKRVAIAPDPETF